MNILIILVVTMFIITGTYVGYHASQQTGTEAGGHNIMPELKFLNKDMGSIKNLQNSELDSLLIKPDLY